MSDDSIIVARVQQWGEIDLRVNQFVVDWISAAVYGSKGHSLYALQPRVGRTVDCSIARDALPVQWPVASSAAPIDTQSCGWLIWRSERFDYKVINPEYISNYIRVCDRFYVCMLKSIGGMWMKQYD